MKVNYVKRIEKRKKELQSKQMTIGLPTLIFIEYSGDKKKYRIDYRYDGRKAEALYWDKSEDCIIPPGYNGMVLIDFLGEVPPDIEDGGITSVNIADLRKENRIEEDQGISFGNWKNVENSEFPEVTVELFIWDKNKGDKR